MNGIPKSWSLTLAAFTIWLFFLLKACPWLS